MDEQLAQVSTGGAVRARSSFLLTFWEELLQRHSGLKTLAKFVVVGAGGYLAYQLTLFLAYDLSLLSFLPDKHTAARIIFFTHEDSRLLYSTLMAAEVAILCSFTAHTNWTFRGRDVVKKPLWLRLGQFNAKALVSTGGIVTAVVNFLVLGLDIHHVLAVPIGVLVAFGWNWTWDSQFIFRRAAETDGTE